MCFVFFFSSRRRHTRCGRDWSSDVCSSDLVENGCRRPRLAPDPNEVVEDPLLRQLLDQERAVPPTGQAGADDWDPKPLECPAYVDPLAPRAQEPDAGAMALPDLEVRHEQSPIDCGVQRDGNDHQKGERLESMSPASSRARPAYHPTRRRRPGSSTATAATRGRLAT